MEPPLPSGIPHLCFGTVQIGQAYGLANPARMLDDQDARAMLDAAWAGGVRRFDTARAYGEAEARLGAWRAENGTQPALFTKFPPLDGRAALARLADSLAASLQALGVARVDGLLAHRAADLRLPGVAAWLRDRVAAGAIGAFGASAYDPSDIEACAGIEGLGLIQAPFSLADRRVAPLLPALASAGIRLHARSAFLQGALLMDEAALPDHLTALHGPIGRLRRLGQGSGISPLALALGFVLGEPGVDSIVFGAYTLGQLAECLAAARAGPLDPALRAAAAALFDGLPDEAIDPSRWPR